MSDSCHAYNAYTFPASRQPSDQAAVSLSLDEGILSTMTEVSEHVLTTGECWHGLSDNDHIGAHLPFGTLAMPSTNVLTLNSVVMCCADRIIRLWAPGFSGVVESYAPSIFESELMAVNSPIERLRDYYSFRNEGAVAAFLESHADVETLLRKAADRLGAYYSDARLMLDVIADPEDPSFITLSLKVRTHQSPRDAVSNLVRAHREWWVAALSSIDTQDVSLGVEPS